MAKSSQLIKSSVSVGDFSLTSFRNHIWFFLACVLPSLGIVNKYGKVYGVVLYLLFAAFWTALVLPWVVRRISVLPQVERRIPRLAVVVLLFFTALFLVVYPLSHSGRLGKGSDRANALNISIPRLFEAKNPYTVRTFLGNPVTPLPGALIIGAPFRLVLGDVAYQNIVWIAVLFLLLCSVATTWTEAMFLWGTVIFLCPALLEDVMTGGDFTTNAIYCAAATLWLLQALACRPRSRDRWQLPILAMFWGVCLCSRPSYMVLVPFVSTYAFQRRGWKALGIVGLALGVYAALVFPIYLSSPQDFSPLHVGAKLTTTGQISPLMLIAGIGLAVIIWLLAWRGRCQEIWFPFAAGSVLLILPVPLVLLADSHRAGHLDLTNLLFVLSPSVFMILAVPLWIKHQDKQKQNTPASAA